MIRRLLLLITFLTVLKRTFTLQNETLVARFQSEIVPNEFIVNYKNYYWPPARKKFLKAAFEKANISYVNWKIIERNNPVKNFPSDFDLLVAGNSTLEDITKIRIHPAIKKISPHVAVRRELKYFEEKSNHTLDDDDDENFISRHLLRSLQRQIYEAVGAGTLWNLGVTGSGVKVAIFDTGLPKNHPHFRNVKERTNWTNEKSLDDGVSHGTFVAGIIASQQECKGMAPDSELHIYRVFTNSQVSYTSWFLDAFNYAIFRKINVLNLSIGGPDFLDQPFVDKVLELSANKVIMVSAIGNDGPLYGSLNNPADQSDVIGVGGINFEEKVARFSSRGMTTWELDWGYGRLKPDIVTYGSQVKGSNVRGGCRALSGTSVASPIVAGAIALIVSGAPKKMELVNPASIKQVLIEGASRLADNNMFEQGHGKLDILKSMKLLLNYTPRVTLSPAYIDFSENGYMWPYSSQQLYCSSMPAVVNVTVLNGIAVSSNIISEPVWHPFKNKHGDKLDVAITYSSVLWPWSGWLAVHIAVKKHACQFEGLASGFVRLVVQSPFLENDVLTTINSTIDFPVTVKIIAQPPKHKRILWDQFHSLRYPPGYVPRDNLKTKADPLDWRADHIHTNFRDMYNHLRNSGYYIDVLREPYTCFNASDYGTLLIVDTEEEFFDEEIAKLFSDVYSHGLSLIVFADWYNTTVMKKIKFFDENTRQWWIPDTGGANIPALNELLKPFGIAFGDTVAEGYYKLGEHEMYFASGANIVKFPKDVENNVLIGTTLNDQGLKLLEDSSKNAPKLTERFVPILGMFQARSALKSKFLNDHLNEAFPSSYEDNAAGDQSEAENGVSQEKNPLINKRILLSSNLKALEARFQNMDNVLNKQAVKAEKPKAAFEGRIAVFGDSNCIDSTHLEKACYWLLDALLEYTSTAYKTDLLKNLNMISKFNEAENLMLPQRMASSTLHRYSKVLDINNKFKKRPITQCQVLNWSKGKAIDSNNFKVKQKQTKTLDNFDLNKALAANLQNLGVQRQSKHPDGGVDYAKNNNSAAFEDESIKLSLIFIVILTFLVLSFYIKWFRRKVRGATSLLP